MTIKRPVIKYRDEHGKVQSKKVDTSYVDVWRAFRATYNTIESDITTGKYKDEDIVDITFKHETLRRKKKWN